VLYYEINIRALREDGMDYLTHNEIETEALGETLARRLGPGDVVAYRGDLGAGKTAFTRGLARGLGCTGRVTSPTFTVVNEYEGRLPLFHFDLYRLEGEDALYDVGWEDYLDRGGVCAVEWSERAEAALPRETVWVSIRRCAESGDWRRITIEGRAGDEAAGP
jgi:tRNA threonylcarbamoyladenosine biosynthesis protein TsaE